MADEMFMYAVTSGIFAFLVAVCFGARGRASAADREKGQKSRTLLAAPEAREGESRNSSRTARRCTNRKNPYNQRLYCSHATVLL